MNGWQKLSPNKRGIIIVIAVLVFLFLIYLAYKKLFTSGLTKHVSLSNSFSNVGYQKNPREWVACHVVEADGTHYKGTNSSGVVIYFLKSDVEVITSTSPDNGLCAYATKTFNVLYKIK